MKFPIKLLCALLALIIGIVGLLVVLNPSKTDAEKMIEKYVAAIDNGDAKAMNKLEDPTKIIKSLGKLSDLMGEDVVPDHDFDKGNRKEALEESKVSAFYLPEDATVDSVKLLAVTQEEKKNESYLTLSIKYISAKAIIEVTYTTEDGTTETVQKEESFDIWYNKSTYVIVA